MVAHACEQIMMHLWAGRSLNSFVRQYAEAG